MSGAGAQRTGSSADWQAYLESLAAFGMRPGLERVSLLLDGLGRPQDAYRVIHVVGTNGKSSTTRYCEALLRAHGLRSGGYLSPHISGLDRARAGRRAVPWTRACSAAPSRRCARPCQGCPQSSARRRSSRCSRSRRLLALAESGVEAAALEAGLGGRLDATNVLDAPVVVLTNIALEHTEVLGDTRELIFAEKAAVIKGGDAVFGPLDGLEDEARRVCAGAGATPHFLRAGAHGPAALAAGDLGVDGAPSDFAVTLKVDDAEERWAGLSVPTPALYQVDNAGLAVAAVRLLLGRLDGTAARDGACRHRRPRPPAEGRRAAAGARRRRPQPRRRAVLAQSLAAVAVPRPTVGVLAIMRDKDYGEMLERFLPLLDGAVCTQASEPRSLAAEELAAALRAAAGRLGRAFPAPEVEPDPHAAVALARARAGPSGSVLIGGSLYLLEDLRDVLAGS